MAPVDHSVPNGEPRSAATQPDSRPPHVIRLWSVAALIAINVIVGVWFRLNRPDGIPQFSLGSLIVGMRSRDTSGQAEAEQRMAALIEDMQRAPRTPVSANDCTR